MKEMKANNKLGEAIKEGCKRLGINQKELSLRCGCYTGMVSRYVRGKDTPSRRTTEKIERELGFEKGYLESLIERNKKADPTRYSPSKTEVEILAAWNRGERTPHEISRITGYDIRTIDKYIPVEVEEEK